MDQALLHVLTSLTLRKTHEVNIDNTIPNLQMKEEKAIFPQLVYLLNDRAMFTSKYSKAELHS